MERTQDSISQKNETSIEKPYVEDDFSDIDSPNFESINESVHESELDKVFILDKTVQNGNPKELPRKKERPIKNKGEKEDFSISEDELFKD